MKITEVMMIHNSFVRSIEIAEMTYGKDLQQYIAEATKLHDTYDLSAEDRKDLYRTIKLAEAYMSVLEIK